MVLGGVEGEFLGGAQFSGFRVWGLGIDLLGLGCLLLLSRWHDPCS